MRLKCMEIKRVFWLESGRLLETFVVDFDNLRSRTAHAFYNGHDTVSISNHNAKKTHQKCTRISTPYKAKNEVTLLFMYNKNPIG